MAGTIRHWEPYAGMERVTGRMIAGDAQRALVQRVCLLT